MRINEMDRWTRHCGQYFKQDPLKDCTVLHPVTKQKLHIDMLLFKPSSDYPYWKLCTMGASDYKLPLTFCRRNEFIMFIPEKEPLQDSHVLNWYTDVLLSIALYPAENHMALTFGHSIIWGEKPGTDMFCAFLDMPYPIESSKFLTCKLSALKETDCLQVILLTKYETELLLQKGPEAFYDFLYPQGGNGHFLCERYRSSNF